MLDFNGIMESIREANRDEHTPGDDLRCSFRDIFDEFRERFA